MAYWLMKSEPDVFGIDELARRGTAGWDGVRNYQARNFMRAMKKGDQALFYHSNAEPPGVAGLMEVAREAYPDDSTKGEPAGRWSQVDVRFVEKFPRFLSLDELRAMKGLGGMVLLRKGSRLSVQPVTRAEWSVILNAARRI